VNGSPDSTQNRILIAGCGAIGSVFGGFLHLAGARVTLLGRPTHMAAVAKNGLLLDGLWGAHHAAGMETVADPARLSGRFDWILLTVKCPDTTPMAQAVAPLLAPHGQMVSLQNGLGNLEQVAQAAGTGRAAGARVIFGAEIPAPGRVTVTVCAAPVRIGSPGTTAHPPLEAGLRRLLHLLERTPIPCEWSDDLTADLWAKALYNAALNPLGATLGSTYGELAAQAHTRSIMDRVLEEAFRVAEAAEVRLPWPDAAGYREHFYRDLVPPTARHRSSMLQDLERGRRTEIDAINGYLVAEGARRHVPTPVNMTLTGLVRYLEARNRAGTHRRARGE